MEETPLDARIQEGITVTAGIQDEATQPTSKGNRSKTSLLTRLRAAASPKKTAASGRFLSHLSPYLENFLRAILRL